MERGTTALQLAFGRAAAALAANRVASVALVCMVAQNSAFVLTMRYSRGVLHERYILSTSVLLMELTKLAISAVGMMVLKPPGVRASDMFAAAVRNSPRTSLPAALYFVQNVLNFVGLQNLEAGVFAVLAQLKTLTAAVFGVLLLNKRLSMNQWRALCLLVLAAVLIEMPAGRSPVAHGTEHGSNTLGVLAVLAMVTTSGISGTVTEKLLKDKNTTIWERNFHLSIYSTVFAVLSIALFDGSRVLEEGFFTGYSFVSLAVVLIGAVGGILVAVVMKYTDNIIKGFATAVAICTTSILSVPLLGSQLTSVFWVGVMMVVVSIFNYSDVHPGGPVPHAPAPAQLNQTPKDVESEPRPVEIGEPSSSRKIEVLLDKQ